MLPFACVLPQVLEELAGKPSCCLDAGYSRVVAGLLKNGTPEAEILQLNKVAALHCLVSNFKMECGHRQVSAYVGSSKSLGRPRCHETLVAEYVLNTVMQRHGFKKALCKRNRRSVFKTVLKREAKRDRQKRGMRAGPRSGTSGHNVWTDFTHSLYPRWLALECPDKPLGVLDPRFLQYASGKYKEAARP